MTTFSDDLAALNDIEAESKRVKSQQGNPIQHRSWSTQDVFRSEPEEESQSAPIMAPKSFMTSSPPPTPSPRKKRKIGEVDLGTSIFSRAPAPKAQRSYYGIDIHRLLEEAQAEQDVAKVIVPELPTPPTEQAPAPSKRSSLLWTEKYRARKFTDLIGDERTHRSVMHWLKRWDTTVFGASHRPKPKANKSNYAEKSEEKPHRKILLLTGPPGLGKTTLAHVCAKQAGYEVQEINASDERSGNVVKGRIRDMLGTENVRGVQESTTKKVDSDVRVRKAAKPVCVVVDEVDGVVSGSGGSGEGGFVKALIDLVLLDQKNSAATPLGNLTQAPVRKKKGDRFRLLRPMILICNDVYHPSLRPLRQGPHAEVIHVRKAPVQTLVSRLHGIFDKEGVPCESDGVRRLCEAAWGVSNRREDRNGSGAGEGDMRGIMVVGEWVAGKLRAANSNDLSGSATLTRRWVEDNVISDLAHGGGAARGLGRGGPKDIVDRVFLEGAGFPKSSTSLVTPTQQVGANAAKSATEGQKRIASDLLRQLVDTHGDTDRIVTDCFSTYPTLPFQDDTLLSKPDAAYKWLHFHDTLSSAVYGSNEWELAPYLSAPVLGFHHLFASPTRAQYMTKLSDDAEAEEGATHPFAGTQASWAAHEAEKHNSALLQSLQSSLSLDLSRLFNSTADLSTDLLPHLTRMLSPKVNPIIVGGSGNDKSTASVRKASEQVLVQRAVQAMGASGVRFDRVKVSAGDDTAGGAGTGGYGTQWIYRMEPSLDELALFETGGKGFGEAGAKTRFAVRQVLEQEWRKEESRRAEAARMARFSGGNTAVVGANGGDGELEGKDEVMGVGAPQQKRTAKETGPVVKRDFFGRPITVPTPAPDGGHDITKGKGKESNTEDEQRVWVTYHEGFSNAVRKPITLAELMRDL